MPFGRKPVGDGRQVDFDAVYIKLIKPAIEAAGLEPLRADEEAAGGMIHKPMFERLTLCEYAVADLTTANANVFYELGVRHAARPWSTVPVFAMGWGQLPFDVNGLRAVPYQLSADGQPNNAAVDIEALQARLQSTQGIDRMTDSPVYQLVDGFPDVKHTATDVFRDRVRIASELRAQLAGARDARDVDALIAVETSLGNISNADSAVVLDLYLSYRALKAWQHMIDLAARMNQPLAQTVMVQEQLGLALNRAGRGDEAERMLLDLIARRGVSSETCGILGRVYKDRWESAQIAGDIARASGLLNKAIAAYLQGFEADWRDAYPGVNALTLMELRDPPDQRRSTLLPVVTYAVQRRVIVGHPNYWDHATLLELAILDRQKDKAEEALADTLAAVREAWEPETTARNLSLIRAARTRRGEATEWALDVESELWQAAGKPLVGRTD